MAVGRITTIDHGAVWLMIVNAVVPYDYRTANREGSGRRPLQLAQRRVALHSRAAGARSHDLAANIKALGRDSERQQEAQHETERAEDQHRDRRMTPGGRSHIVQDAHVDLPDDQDGEIN